MWHGPPLGLVLFVHLSNGIRKPPGGAGVGIQTTEECTEPREVTSAQLVTKISVERVLRITKPSSPLHLCHGRAG